MPQIPAADLDATDRRILRALQADGRLPRVALGDKAGGDRRLTDVGRQGRHAARRRRRLRRLCVEAPLRMPGVKETWSSFVLTEFKPPGSVPV